MTSVVLQSDDLDEIDWEWLGGDTTQVQTNYFGKGDTSTYDRGGFSPVANPQSTFHKYTIDWTKDKVDWLIDDKIVRTLTYSEAKGGANFPQTPMQIKLGTWVAGRKDAPKGTVEWAGGYTEFGSEPFKAFYKSVTITDYSKGATSYSYGDHTGSWESIKISTDGSSSDESSSSSSSSSTKTSSGSSSSTSKASSTATTLTTSSTGGASSTKSTPTETGSSNSTKAAPTGPASTTPVTTPNSGARAAANVIVAGAALFLTYIVL